jgi:hypothetical protein
MPVAAPDLSTLPAAFQAGYVSGHQDARQHRRRNRVLEDLAGLTAYATDAARAALPAQGRGRAPLVAQYIAGYIQAYQQATAPPRPAAPARRTASLRRLGK